jgi:hypothetical protein
MRSFLRAKANEQQPTALSGNRNFASLKLLSDQTEVG